MPRLRLRRNNTIVLNVKHVRAIFLSLSAVVLVQLAVATTAALCGVDFNNRWGVIRFLGIDYWLEATSSVTPATMHVPGNMATWYALSLSLLLITWALCFICYLAIVLILFRVASRYFDVAAILCSLVFALAAFLWASGWWWGSSWETRAHRYALELPGTFYVQITLESFSRNSISASSKLERFSFAGISFQSEPNPWENKIVRNLFVPFGHVMVLFALIIIIRCRKVQRLRTWKTHGWCLSCGYDLRATPQQCPECGAVPKEMIDARITGEGTRATSG